MFYHQTERTLEVNVNIKFKKNTNTPYKTLIKFIMSLLLVRIIVHRTELTKVWSQMLT